MTILSTVLPEEVGLSSDRLRRISSWMQLQLRQRKLSGLTTMVARRGHIVHFETCGLADLAREEPMRPDTIFRIYSMTKPLTNVAAMMLYEEGRFQLDDPIARFIPAFKDMHVYIKSNAKNYDRAPAERLITFRDLMTHTSGLTYGFIAAHPVDAMYRDQGLDYQTAECNLKDLTGRVASFPLLSQPGKEWNYSIATDVLGYLVEVISGEPFEHFLRERVLKPLSMLDTDFYVPESKHHRLAANYARDANGELKLIDDPKTSRYLTPRQLCSGGGGLVSTATDYMQFCQMMLNKGELNGVRLLGRKTVELMTRNHLSGDMADMGQPRFSESTYVGIGFGLGFSVMLDPAKAQILGSPGEYAWGGVASTAFWIDPIEDMAVILLTQLQPSSTYPLRRELRVLTYQSIVD